MLAGADVAVAIRCRWWMLFLLVVDGRCEPFRLVCSIAAQKTKKRPLTVQYYHSFKNMIIIVG